ncbi:unnamed protein product [Notodromas monacha]|uniref:Serum response factor homolog n=1 Tax=Notodromas monacha TaxID=399045 RepID=A0A7R9BIT2_9CRUS|nr:unnamed protein product [Notodromas monacha]CAG0915183.1 unnamed protein product [Notodromas monacha]
MTEVPGIQSMTPPSEDDRAPAPKVKKTRGRLKINMKLIGEKKKRMICFSKRKAGLMKKAYELSELTGTEVMLLVASETGHVYTFATKKLQPMITSDAGKALIQTCLNSPDDDEPIGAHLNPDAFEERQTAVSCSSDTDEAPEDFEEVDERSLVSCTSEANSPANPSQFVILQRYSDD